jgi:hypothetical protein
MIFRGRRVETKWPFQKRHQHHASRPSLYPPFPARHTSLRITRLFSTCSSNSWAASSTRAPQQCGKAHTFPTNIPLSPDPYVDSATEIMAGLSAQLAEFVVHSATASIVVAACTTGTSIPGDIVCWCECRRNSMPRVIPRLDRFPVCSRPGHP